ncbi:hypothetical protein, partial [Nocardia sp. CC201C]
MATAHTEETIRAAVATEAASAQGIRSKATVEPGAGTYAVRPCTPRQRSARAGASGLRRVRVDYAGGGWITPGAAVEVPRLPPGRVGVVRP